MSNARNKSIDKTFLSVNQAEKRGFLHRDYIAHCFRWSHVVKHCMKQKTLNILDIGCGKELPLLKTLYTGKKAPQSYTGVDVRPLEIPAEISKIMEKTVVALISVDFGNICSKHAAFIPTKDWNVITCFEVLEHVEPEHAFRMLKNIHKMADNADIFISTPIFNQRTGAAGNHVSEYGYEAMLAMLMKAGFVVKNNFGTFASIKDYKPTLIKDGYGSLFDKMSEYYDTNVLATFFAPLYPRLSRNVLWHIRKSTVPSQEPEFSPSLAEPQNCSSDKWPSFAKEFLL